MCLDSFQRITPAWAGKRCAATAGGSSGWDHPRVGGEKHSGSCRTLTRSGSPPRGRGKAYIFPTFWGVERITPAWAGKSCSRPCAPGRPTDHPRVGGEKIHHNGYYTSEWGSPPRGRGKAGFRLMQANGFGITPAWAGKSDCPGNGRFTLRDHPRVGGEK